MAAEGLIPIPSGSVTFAVFRYELAITSLLATNGMPTSTVVGSGVSTSPPLVVTPIVGLNGHVLAAFADERRREFRRCRCARLRGDVEFGVLRDVADARVGQVGAVAGLPVEDQPRAEDRRVSRGPVRRVDVADREADVLIDRIKRADDDRRFTRGAGRETDHRGHSLKRHQVVDRKFDARVGAGRRPARRRGRGHGQVVEPDQGFRRTERRGNRGELFDRALDRFPGGVDGRLRVDAQALRRVDDDFFDEAVRKAFDVRRRRRVQREVGKCDWWMSGRLFEPFFSGRFGALPRIFSQWVKAHERAWRPRHHRSVAVFFTRQCFPVGNAESTLRGRRDEDCT